MTRREQFIRKYGPVEGPEKLRLINTNAANARWKAFYRAKLQELRPPSGRF